MSENWSAAKKTFLEHSGSGMALGGPGAGKTHVALAKARDEILRGALKPGQKIVFLSFARPTVSRIVEKAAELVGRKELAHLEINTYHSFAWSILKSHAYLLNGRNVTHLLPPPQAAAHLADIEKGRHAEEKERLFSQEGKLHFDLFAGAVAQLFKQSQKLANIYSDSYPIIILDEFQDTNDDEWEMIRQMGQRSRLIALADPEQRIYEFRGADPRRIGDFVREFGVHTFDFTGENHRSPGTDITVFGNELLTGANRGKTYTHVKLVRYGFYRGRSTHYTLKSNVLSALSRLSKVKNYSLAVLVPSRPLMLQVSEYLSAERDGLPPLRHDVAMDTEPPALAAAVIASLLEGGTPADASSRLLSALYNHIRGRRGNKPTPQAELDFAGAIGSFVSTGKVRGAKRQLAVQECLRIAAELNQLPFGGNPAEDWLAVRALLELSQADSLVEVSKDARFLRLLHKGSTLRTSLSELWKRQGNYVGAQKAVDDALLQEHFAAAQKDMRGIHLMTIHKSKGKEFDEVVLYDGMFHRLLRAGGGDQGAAQDLLALRVGVTRAMRRTTILTPKNDSCPLL